MKLYVPISSDKLPLNIPDYPNCVFAYEEREHVKADFPEEVIVEYESKVKDGEYLIVQCPNCELIITLDLSIANNLNLTHWPCCNAKMTEFELSLLVPYEKQKDGK